MFYYQKISISPNIIKLFQDRNDEALVLSLMNSSKIVFPEEYEAVHDQSHGECDFIGKESNKKFDAKLPFLTQQISMLTNGKSEQTERVWYQRGVYIPAGWKERRVTLFLECPSAETTVLVNGKKVIVK